MILPVDQGFEHGPARSFAPNPAGYDPRYHFELAHRRGLQRLRRAARLPRGRGRGVRRRDPAHPEAQQLRLARRRASPAPALTGSVDEALRLGCVGDRLHDLPGLVGCATRCTRSCATSPRRRSARAWRSWCGRIRAAPASRRRARRRSTSSPTRRRSPRQLGAHVIKVKLPTAHIEQDAAKKVYEKEKIPIAHARRARAPRGAERLRRPPHRHLLRRRGEGDRRRCCDEVRAIRDGGGFGSIIGRNSFQRPQRRRARLPAQRHGHLRREVASSEPARRSPASSCACARWPPSRRPAPWGRASASTPTTSPSRRCARRWTRCPCAARSSSARASATRRRCSSSASTSGAGGDGDLEVDIAVDPLEGTNLCATGAPGRHRRAGRVEQGRAAPRPRLLHGEDHRRAGGARRHRSRRAGRDQPEGDRQEPRPRRRRPGRHRPRPGAARASSSPTSAPRAPASS